MFFDPWDWAALVWFFICWVGYTRFASRTGPKRMSLTSIMFEFRKDWMQRLLLKENRISDMSAISNLERNAAFFASTSILIIAGLFTVLSAATESINLMLSLSFIEVKTQESWELKVLLLVMIFIYAFFTFTWCVRQYGFVSVVMGGAPLPNEQLTEQQKAGFILHGAKVLNLAGQQFNLGLRAYYFSLAVLGWFMGPVWFMGVTTLVVLVLFRREFLSRTMVALDKTRGEVGLPPYDVFGIISRKQKK